jgi:diguanylate cyclase (GGDEF)-like protein
MISFRKTMESDALRQELDAKDRQLQTTQEALKAAVRGVREHALKACPPIAAVYYTPIDGLERQLQRADSDLRNLAQQITENLEGFGREASIDYDAKSYEIREVVRLMGAAAESFAAHNAGGSQELASYANAFESIAGLPDLTEIRRELRGRVQELRDWSERRSKQDDESLASLRGELEVVRNRLAQAESNANHDALTGLVNRRGLEKAFQMRAGQGIACTVILFDLNRFKHINDHYGHATGDAVLTEFARRLAAAIRGTDVAARWGGDEFVALLQCPISDGLTRSRQITAQICGVYNMSNATRVRVSAAIGVAEPLPGESLSDVIDRADKGLYQQKASAPQAI